MQDTPPGADRSTDEPVSRDTDESSPDSGRRRGRLTRRRALGLVGLAAAGGAGAWLFRPAPVSASPGWTTSADLPRARGEMKAAVVGPRIYVPGGLTGVGSSTAQVDVYHLGTDEWTTVSPMPAGLNHHATAALDGTIYVVGGNEDIRGPPGRHAFSYEPDADEWQPAPSLPDGRWGHEVIPYDGRLFVLGGVPETDPEPDTFVFDPGAEQWERLAAIPTPREHVAASELDGELVVAGGRWGSRNRATLEAYDPEGDVWRPLAPMPTPRSGSGAATLGSRLHVVGGENPATFGGWATDVHEVYDPAGDGWDDAAPVPLPVHGVPAVALEGRLFAIGGAWRQGAWSVTAWSNRTFVYDPGGA